MNPLLKLRGKFSHSTAPGAPGAPELPADGRITSKKLLKLRNELLSIRDNWNEISENPVISVYYERTIPKSRRPKRLFSGNQKPSDFFIVGAKFWGEGKTNHQFVYCVSKDNISKYIQELTICAEILSTHFDGYIDRDKLAAINHKNNRDSYSKVFESAGIKRTPFSQLIVDASSILRIGIDRDVKMVDEDAFVTLYRTGLTATKLLELLEIPFSREKIYGDYSLMLSKNEYSILVERVPYLISMSFDDELDFENDPDEDEYNQFSSLSKYPSIPAPQKEPVIGVIDTLFLKDTSKIYFADWVTFEDCTSDDEPVDELSYLHGTLVDSIIVDGPTLNPMLDDGCGRFRVKHYGITRKKKIHLFSLIRQIEAIVSDPNNRNITVWNLCLGDERSISDFSISPLAAVLDELQSRFKVIFVIAGTNNPKSAPEGEFQKIGSPADSVNSIVVNSVKSNGEIASYTRVGPVLSFFTKPDIAYYGGDRGDGISTWGPHGIKFCSGTSFAAPWISRKMAYLIDIKGFSREAAKALLIDSASNWTPEADVESAKTKGHGIAPVHINEILSSKDDEIKFIITGKTELYQTYNYKLPIPISHGKFPYNARATLCYFPNCSISQGVDYTDTELDFRFGRLKNGKMVPINNDLQNDIKGRIVEKDARTNFRKWDNVKIISEKIKHRKIAKKMYDTPLWGIDITSKKRLDNKERENVNFGIVVTLKEMNGKNRIDSFIRACQANEWFVESIHPAQDFDFLVSLDEDIDFEA